MTTRAQLVEGIVDAARELIGAGRIDAADRLLALIGSSPDDVETVPGDPNSGRTAKRVRDAERMRLKRLSERQSRDSRQESPATVASVAPNVARLARASEFSNSGVVSGNSEECVNSESSELHTHEERPGATVARQSPQESPATVATVVRATLTSQDVAREWNRASQQVTAGGVGHAHSYHLEHYALIASALNLRTGPKSRPIAVRALCEWVWAAPEGLKGRGNKPTPKMCAARIDDDIASALAWWESKQDYQPVRATG